MEIASLGYIGLGVTDVAAWRAYATNFLGASSTDADDGGLLLRIDKRAWRIAIHPTGEDDICYAGWEVPGPEAFAALLKRLGDAGLEVTLDPALAQRRGVMALARCTDPAGVSCEFFWGASDLKHEPFASPVGVSGFRTGQEGLGHVVILYHDLDAMKHFYQDLLGFRYSDFINGPMGPTPPIPVTFLHCNPRHHSFAYAPVPPDFPKRLAHFMLQTETLDDVGYAMDRCRQEGYEMALTLGRHSNDEMVSFYAVTPSGFEVEYGWGAVSIDEAHWPPTRHDKISAWGHQYVRTSSMI